MGNVVNTPDSTSVTYVQKGSILRKYETGNVVEMLEDTVAQQTVNTYKSTVVKSQYYPFKEMASTRGVIGDNSMYYPVVSRIIIKDKKNPTNKAFKIQISFNLSNNYGETVRKDINCDQIKNTV
jgi:hypothetical protein